MTAWSEDAVKAVGDVAADLRFGIRSSVIIVIIERQTIYAAVFICLDCSIP
jgi:4-hydroxybenzoate polyprenyltransferase